MIGVAVDQDGEVIFVQGGNRIAVGVGDFDVGFDGPVDGLPSTRTSTADQAGAATIAANTSEAAGNLQTRKTGPRSAENEKTWLFL